MSKAFTKDDDAADAPLVLPRRAPLPPGTPNYVTARGLALLQAELTAARSSAPAPSGSDAERARQGALHAARVTELEQRVVSAVFVDSREQSPGEVRFGASVRFENAAGAERTVRIVGVDEANAGEGAIAFAAPLARALLGKRVGDTALLDTPGGEEELTVLEIAYG
jgi:transcription elongation factor GreB